MDDQTHIRIHIESEAVLGILAWCETEKADLINSVALEYEASHNPHPHRKAFIQETLSKTLFTVQATATVEQRARTFGQWGIKALDSLHLACAIEARADYFCTCDDRFLRLAKQMPTEQTKVVSLLELIEAIEP